MHHEVLIEAKSLLAEIDSDLQFQSHAAIDPLQLSPSTPTASLKSESPLP